MMDEQIKTTSNHAQFIEPNVLQLRLDTNELIEKIEVFISGKRITYLQDRTTGKPVAHEVKVGEPIANQSGTQCIINWLQLQLNAAVVQGYIKEVDQYFYFLERTRKTLAKILLVNSPAWKIKRENRQLIISSIMNMLELFVSRTLDNTERDSYTYSLAARIQSLTPPSHEKKGW